MGNVYNKLAPLREGGILGNVLNKSFFVGCSEKRPKSLSLDLIGLQNADNCRVFRERLANQIQASYPTGDIWTK